jgi:hypothetical protein
MEYCYKEEIRQKEQDVRKRLFWAPPLLSTLKSISKKCKLFFYIYGKYRENENSMAKNVINDTWIFAVLG